MCWRTRPSMPDLDRSASKLSFQESRVRQRSSLLQSMACIRGSEADRMRGESRAVVAN